MSDLPKLWSVAQPLRWTDIDPAWSAQIAANRLGAALRWLRDTDARLRALEREQAERERAMRRERRR